MGSLAIFNAYTMRSAMSVAITEMAQAKRSIQIDEQACPVLNASGSAGPNPLPAVSPFALAFVQEDFQK